MNGRIYDPELGRMLSPDPYVQVPEYSQNFNRYSYVLNNPLNKTDPTGYSWVSKAFHKIGSWVKENWRTVATIVLASALMLTGAGAFIFGFMYGLAGGTAAGIAAMSTFTLNMAVGATIGGITGAIGAALSGGNLGDVLRGAAVGAVQGAISSGPLHYLEGAKGMQLAHIAGHGVTGGAANAAMGGKFQDGFLSAAASAAAVHTGLTSTAQGSTGEAIGMAGRTAASAIIGGTASALGGGKFANGAYTSAFQHLLNSELPARRLQHAEDLLAVAESYNGLREQGSLYERSTISNFHRSTTLARDEPTLCTPSTAWCSSMVNYILELTGNVGTDSASSQSWLRWGRGVSEPVVGALAVFTDYDLQWRRTEQGHVGFVKGITDNNSVVVFGGNQSDMAKYSTYSRGTTKRFSEGKHVGWRKLTSYRVPNLPNRALIVAPLIRSTGGNGNLESTR